jgi:hypothetical protein
MSKTAGRAHQTLRRRPAESVAAGGGLAGLAVALTAGDRVTVIVALIGFVPAVVSFVVENGGVRGLVGKLMGSRTASGGAEPDAAQ